jgi:hypothetical protein
LFVHETQDFAERYFVPITSQPCCSRVRNSKFL